MSNTNTKETLKQDNEAVEKPTINLEQEMILNNLGLGNDIQPTTKIETESTQAQQTKQNKKNISNSLLTVESDRELHLGDTNSLLEHNLQYTALLKAYVDIFASNSVKKMKNKQILFNIAMGMLISIPTVSFLLIIGTLICMACGIITVFESIPEVVSALTAILGTFMVIPKMITKYLYNKKEEEHLANIIGKIQDYDKDIRGRL